MYNRIQNFLLNLPPIFRNIFFLTTIAFAVWMIFLDENNMINQYRKRSELIDLEKKRDYYKNEIFKAQEKFELLTTNAASQEKFARENYWMKKDNEDVFIIEKK